MSQYLKKLREIAIMFVQVRLQTQPTVNPVYNGVLDCVSKTAKWEGIGGFYKGV